MKAQIILIFVLFCLYSKVHGLSRTLWNLEVGESSDTPAAREGHTVTPHKNELYLFGGYDGKYRYFNDLWVYYPSAKSWKKITPQGSLLPEARAGHSAHIVNGKLIIYGGIDNHQTFSDIYAYDMELKQWQRGFSRDQVALGRCNHASTLVGNSIYIFGGYASDAVHLGDMWQITLVESDRPDITAFNVQFEFISPAGETPSSREGATMIVVSQQVVTDSSQRVDKILLYGGLTTYGVLQKELYEFDLESKIWLKIHSPSIEPGKRAFHTMIPLSYTEIAVYGGCDYTATVYLCYSDFWVYNVDERSWNLLPLSRSGSLGKTKQSKSGTLTPIGNDEPKSTKQHAMVLFRGKYYLFGGCELSMDCYGDMYGLSVKSLRP